MSNLLASSTKEAEVSMCPVEGVYFEDFITSESLDIYKLLELSSLREKEGVENQSMYLSQFVQLLSNQISQSSELPIAFKWQIDNEVYHSTSLLFELYCTTLSLGEKLFNSANNYKVAIDLFQECKQLLKKWKTSELVYPSCPYKCTNEYLENMLYLTRASMMLAMKGEKKSSGNALATAMNFAGKVGFHIPHFSETAMNHYLLARSLLYHTLSKEDNVEQGDSANKAYTAAKESLACCRLLDRSKCHIDTELDSTLNTMLEEIPDFLQSMEQVYYSVEVPLDSIRLPASVQA